MGPSLNPTQVPQNGVVPQLAEPNPRTGDELSVSTSKFSIHKVRNNWQLWLMRYRRCVNQYDKSMTSDRISALLYMLPINIYLTFLWWNNFVIPQKVVAAFQKFPRHRAKLILIFVSPIPSEATMMAVVTALLVWETNNIDEYTRIPGIHPPDPAFVEKMPVYRHAAGRAKPVRTKPTRVIQACTAITAARCRYLSDTQAKNMMLAAYINWHKPHFVMLKGAGRSDRENIRRSTVEPK